LPVDSEVFGFRLARLLILREHLCFDTGITHKRLGLQMLCTPSHTVPHQDQHPSGERLFVRKPASIGFDFGAIACNVTIKSLVDSPFGTPQTQTF
jgi:hypothetical protein